MALLAAPRAAHAAATPGSACITGDTWCSISYTTSRNNPTYSPQYIGVNLGHHHQSDSSWLAFIEHLGVNGAWLRRSASRLTLGFFRTRRTRRAAALTRPRRPRRRAVVRNFGMGGLLINTTQSTMPNYVFVETVGGGSPVGWRASANGMYYGRDMFNNPVVDLTSFNYAVANLSLPQGRQYLIPGQANNAGSGVTWVYPPAWTQVDINMGTTDISYNGAELTGNPNDTVNRLAQMGIATLGVEFLPCNNFAFTSMDPNNPAYWGERWELYKHTYVVAGWSWKRAMQKIEFWNEVSARDAARCIMPPGPS